MKRKATLILVAILAFIVGVASAMGWIYFHNLHGSNEQKANTYVQPEFFRGPERLHICLKRFDINLGDSFEYVDSLIHLSPDPNGPNQNIAWQQGKFTDFFSLSQSPIEIDKENRLNPAIYCTFDDQKRLKSFFISWKYEGKQVSSIKRKIIDTLIQKEHICMKEKRFDGELNAHLNNFDYGDYNEVFAYDFRETSSWSVGYVMETKDAMYGRRLTTHSTGLAISKSFIFQVNCSPVNSGVRLQTWREL